VQIAIAQSPNSRHRPIAIAQSPNSFALLPSAQATGLLVVEYHHFGFQLNRLRSFK
jgi:hypothetical protein